MRSLIIGAGLSGLRAALELENPLIVESSQNLGGLLSSYSDLNVERFYHHFFEFDEELISLLRKLNLSRYLQWHEVKTGFFVNGRIYSMSTPLEILRYPYLTFTEKFKLAKFVLKCRRMMRERSLLKEMDEIGAEEWIKKESSDGIYQKFFRILLESKFGNDAKRVSAAWVVGRVGMRSSRTPRGEKVGYLKGGFQQLVEALAEKSEAEILTGVRARGFEISGDKVIVKTSEGCVEGDYLIITAPEFVKDLKWQRTSCALVATEDPVLDEIYWLNVQGIPPVGAIIAHTNMVSPEEYGYHLTYLVSYTDELNEKTVRKILRNYFGVERVEFVRVENSCYTAPLYERGYANRIVPYERDGIYYAGMFSETNYPERSMEGSLLAGKEVAKVVRREE